ncbi:MAG: hypothetical protein ACKVJA_01470 [Flavobacteriales bacterium]
MKRNSTQLNLSHQFSQIKTSKSEQNIEENLQVKDSTIQNILAYSKSVKCIKTGSLGMVLMVNN